jgi:hypothetical protein
MTETPESPFMTQKEYADYVRRSVRTTRRWAVAGIGPQPRLINGRPHYLRVAVRQFYEADQAVPA